MANISVNGNVIVGYIIVSKDIKGSTKTVSSDIEADSIG